MLNNNSFVNFHRFVNRREIGKGGMATVYRAVDTVDGGFVALKLYDRLSIKQTALKEAFNREVEALQSIDHPNIVEYIEKGEQDNTPYIVMELLPKSIQDWVADRKYDIGGWDDFYEYFAEPLLSALKYSHTQKIAHRDIKPSNVRFNDKYELKIIDYNICINQQEEQMDDSVLGSFTTRMYSPDKSDWYSSTYMRDVFGFAATCVDVMSRIYNIDIDNFQNPKELLDHPDFDWPDDIIELFQKILDCSPDSEHNCTDLYLTIDKIQQSRDAEQTRTKDSQRIPIFSTTDKEIPREDLSSYTWISPHPTQKSHKDFLLYGTKNQYWITVEPNFSLFDTRCLVIRKVTEPTYPNEHENIKKSALKLNYKFQFNPINSKNLVNIDRLINEIRFHENENGEQSGSEILKDSIKSILENKLKSIKNPKAYKWEKRGELFSIHELSESAVKIVEKQFLVCTEAGRQLCRVRLKQKVHDLYEYEFADGADATIPNSGIIKEDVNYAKNMYNAQKKAVEKIFDSDIPNPRLWSVIKNPTEARCLDSAGEVGYFNNNLDDSKWECVKKFLNVKDFLLIEGPPGTGKTDLIIELLNQQINVKKNSRILVVSETNVAIDNIVERLGRLHSNIDFVRIGNVSNKKISSKAQDYLVEMLSGPWREEIKLKAIQYQNQWCKENGLDIEEMKLYSNLQRYCFELVQRNKLVSELDKIKKTVADGVQEVSDIQEELTNKIKLKKRELESQKKIIQDIGTHGQWLSDIENTGPEFVLDMINQHFESDPIKEKAKAILDLSNDWLLRFTPGENYFDYVLVRSKQIVFSTTMLLAMTSRYKDLEFDLVILDEASKSALIESIVPLSTGKKWVLVGDRKQLPPYLDSDGGEVASNQLESLSLFKYLFDDFPEPNKHFLHKQYRMSPGICELVSRIFYDRKLESGTFIEDNSFLNYKGKEIIWIDTSKEGSREDRKGKSGSFTNPLEVEIVEKVFMSLEKYLKNFSHPKNTVLVISGYSGQVDKIKQRLGTNRFKNFNFKVNTIDACQGHEADIVLFSIVRSNEKGKTGFMSEMERLNVGLSRARKGLIIIGDLSFCLNDMEYLGKVATFIKSQPSICTRMFPSEFGGGL